MPVSSSDNPTFYLALYGAILGTAGTVISVILAANELRKGKRAIRISCRPTRISPLVMFLGDDSPIEYSSGLEVKVLNNGPRPVEVTLVGVRVSPDAVIAREAAAHSPPLPKKLEFSDSMTFEFYVDEISKRLPKEAGTPQNIRAAVQDAEDRWYYAPLPRSVLTELTTRKQGA